MADDWIERFPDLASLPEPDRGMLAARASILRRPAGRTGDLVAIAIVAAVVLSVAFGMIDILQASLAGAASGVASLRRRMKS